ncbi:MAG: ATP-binding protein [Candidatus Liptonbacteria bacterium]|nr:ATP-binding protein [Candidatus Liptonbacteria bacterium]
MTPNPDGKPIADLVAPAGAEINQGYLKIGDKFSKTLFVLAYPRYLTTGWFSSIINMPDLLDISIFIHPVETKVALKKLKRKAAQVEASLMGREEKGLVRDPALETASQDIETLRENLQQSVERLFNVGLYITIFADSSEQLVKLEERITTELEGKLVYAKSALFQQAEGFASTLPLGLDKIDVHAPLNSGPASSIFPFSSSSLTSEEGILYGINRHNNTLIIFDRFKLENANMVIFAQSGSGKSYAAKLEIIRSLMMDTDVIIIDPENEYERLARAMGGSFFKISLSSENTINPFDIPVIPEDEEPEEVLRSHIVNVTGLVKLMLEGVTQAEDAILDRAVSETYASRGIIPGRDFAGIEPPLLQDLQAVLENMEGGRDLAQRLYKFTTGSFSGFANKPTSVDINNRLIVFSIRDLEDALRPIAMYLVLNFVWNTIRTKLKRRLLVMDEAWWMMKYEDSASFLFGLVKRARKYYLGVTTITQDVDDFMRSPYGKPIITNSALQILLKQSPATIDVVGKAFNLTKHEQDLLLEAERGTGLFVAGLNHVAIQIIPSYYEDKIITTDPEQLLKLREE